MSQYNIKYRVGDLVKTKNYPIAKITEITISDTVKYRCKGFNSVCVILEQGILGHVEVISLTEE